nr:uncharacterized protein K02A2.6-like [Haemonchus contortus]
MEMQFNRRHGAKPKKFEPKDLVFARDFRSGQPRWSPGHVLRRHGRTLYDVLVQGSIWKRHANQLRPRDSLGETIDLTNAFDMPFNSSPDSPAGTSSTLPLFPMATTAPLTTTTTTTTTTTAPPTPPAVAPRRSTRTRRPPDFLQIDPYAKSYRGRAIPIPDWYVICYTLSDGCQICRLDILCENDLTEACADLFILGSSPRASNSTIDYWIKAGDNFPFPNSSQVELTTSVQRNSIPVDVRKLSIAAGEKKRLTVSGLKANEVYDIRRCVEIRLSPALTQNQQFNFTDTTSRLCSEEGYRTQPNVARIPHPLWIALITILLLVIR